MTLVISPDAKIRPGGLAEVLRFGWDVSAPYAGGPLNAERLIDLPENGKCQTECLPLTRPASRSPTNCPVKRGTSANGHRVDTGELPGLIDALLDLVGVADVEVYDGSCFRQV